MTDEEKSRKTLPTMVWGYDDEEPIVVYDIVEANLPADTRAMLAASGQSVFDVLAGTVDGLDPWEIIDAVWQEHLPADEYARCIARLPDLLAEYENPAE